MARILLVGKDDENRASVRAAIQQLSTHEVVEAASGLSALERVAREPFDLVLLEVQLPDLDGFEVCRRVRGKERTEDVPVVFLTAAAQQVDSRLRGLELGAADFIVQPIDNLELLARIGSVLRSKALADEVRRHNHELAGKVVERTRQLEEMASELRIERDALRETFDVFDEALLLLDASGVVQTENTAGRKLLEEPAAVRSGQDQAQGQEDAACAEMDALEGSLRVAADLAALARQAIAREQVCDSHLSHGGRQLEVRAYPAAGHRALIYARDVTAQRDQEVRRLQSEKLASIGMLAAGVAHEINNPASFVLANIEAVAGLLRSTDEALTEGAGANRTRVVKDLLFEAMTIVQESKEGMARIHRIVRDLHSFSRVDDSDSTVADVNSAVESALTMLRNELRYRTTVERELRAAQPVQANAARLGQVFLNLILNAAHALPEGNLNRNQLRVRSFDEDGTVVVEVEDNGPGIAPEIMPRIFESFFTTKPPGLGTGLGLPISREIVRSLGGELTAESPARGPDRRPFDGESGPGALFRVRLPALEGPVVEPARPSGGAPRRRRRIVAVDDEALLLKAYRRMLGEHHDIETRLGAREALALFEKDRAFDAVLCDLQMPEMSGAEFYAIVARRWPELAQRFIFITGGAFSPEARRFLEEGLVSCVNKPFQVDDLLELIEHRLAH
jgi:signal transduction histidine kinase/DNA-binding response OmpR family regulator